jgi:hypothetical protein
MKDSWIWLLFGVVALVTIGGGVALTQSGFPQYVLDFSAAIEFAEGFNVPGSKPQRQNNPGDISGVGGILSFPTLQDGFNALYNQVLMMFNNTSTHYNSGMSIAQIGSIYAGGDPNWGINVASYLGVDPTTTLDQLRSTYSV